MNTGNGSHNGTADVLAYARLYRKAGCSILPIKTDGSKAPAVNEWAYLQNRLLNDNEIGELFGRRLVGIGFIGGKVSGNLELLDVDSPELVEQFEAAVNAAAPGLLAKLSTIETPRQGAGRHYWFKCHDVVIPGNTKLAETEPLPAEKEDGTPDVDPRTGKQRLRPKVLIETRGEGGYALVPGCPDSCHKARRPYRHICGPKLTEVQVISGSERDILFRIARSFNRNVEYRPDKSETSTPRDGLSPGDDYNQRATWEEILEPAGWKRDAVRGEVTLWTRPGKEMGTSATTGLKSAQGNELLCVFTQNGYPFTVPPGRTCGTYSKFAAFAVLNHEGDYSAAAKELANQGYGSKPEAKSSATKKKKAAPVIEPYRPFPVEALPELVRRYVVEASDAIFCDRSFIALPVLGVLARAIGNRRVIKLKNTWREPAIFWAAIVGKSGSHKSPAILEVMRPLERKAAEAIEKYKQALLDHQQELARYDAEMAAWKQQQRSRAKKGEPQGERDLAPWEPEEPQCQRYIVSEITIEALADRLSGQFDGVLLVRDELAGWINGIGEYKGGKGSDNGHWLACWSAAPFTVDRKTGAKKMIHIPRGAVSIVGGIQPGILRQALGREHMQDGMCARMLLACPGDKPVRWSDATVSAATVASMEGLLDNLLAIECGADADGKPEPFPLSLTPAAKTVWVTYYNRHREELAGLDEDLAAAWSKLEAYTARFALVFQLVRDPDSQAVDEESVSAAIVLSDWFGGEARRVYGILKEDQEDSRVRQLVEWIRRHGGEVSARDLMRGGPCCRTAEDADAMLQELVELKLGQWLPVPTTPKGGKPTRVFRLTDVTDIAETQENQREDEGSVNVSDGIDSESEGDDSWNG